MPKSRSAVPAPSARERILQAATELFAARGFEGSSTHAIADRAGMSQGLVRHHFGTKEALWRAALERGLATLRAELGALRARSPAPSAVDLLERIAAQRELVAIVVHALLEPGARRERMVREQLAPAWAELCSELASSIAGPWHRERASSVAVGAWLAAGLAVPLFAPAFERAAPGELTAHRVRLETWLHARAPAHPRGPWAKR